MHKKKGLTLIEITIAMLILSFGMAASLKLYSALNEILSTNTYYYTAVNIARDVLEFGETGPFAHEFRMLYKYPGSNSLSLDGPPWPSQKGYDPSNGYGLKEWWFFIPREKFSWGYPEPFEFLGDIKAKGLVPKLYPDSVEIYYECVSDPRYQRGGSNPKLAYQEKVIVTWRINDKETGKLEAGVIPIVSNNQLTLEIQDFWWK